MKTYGKRSLLSKLFKPKAKGYTKLYMSFKGLDTHEEEQ